LLLAGPTVQRRVESESKTAGEGGRVLELERWGKWSEVVVGRGRRVLQGARVEMEAARGLAGECGSRSGEDFRVDVL
jgi:hypothetical protein